MEVTTDCVVSRGRKPGEDVGDGRVEGGARFGTGASLFGVSGAIRLRSFVGDVTSFEVAGAMMAGVTGGGESGFFWKRLRRERECDTNVAVALTRDAGCVAPHLLIILLLE